MKAPRRLLGVPPNIFFLGVVSFLADVSSEMTLTILPLFLTSVLGVGPAIIGLIEGIAESTATTLRVFSGWLADRTKKFKALTVVGYTLSSLAKPFLYFATTWGMVLGVRFTDRLGKAVRTAPRDALVASSSTSSERGRGFGFHRALDSYGAVVGLALAALAVFLAQRTAPDLTRASYQKLVLIGIIPAFLAPLLLLWKVKEPPSAPPAEKPPSHQALSGRFKLFLAIMVVFTLGRFSDAFLILRAHDLGLSPFYILVVLAVFNLVYAGTSIPAGVLSDRLGRKAVLLMGFAVYALIYLGFARAIAPWQVVFLFVAYGLYYGATEGVGRAYVADLVPEGGRGTAYGLYHGVVGLAALPASLLAGVLWQAISPAAPFYLGASLAAAAMAGLFFLR
jgi:MFS family permease